MDPRLLEAARSGDVALLRQLYAEDPSLLKSSAPHRNTVLHLAIIFRQEDLAKELCFMCPSLLSTTNGDGNTPLLLAAATGLYETVAFVITLLFQMGDVEEGMGVLKHTRATNRAGNNAMHEALWNGHGRVALTLLRADPELAQVLNNNGESPLYSACNRRLEEVVAALLQMPAASHEGPMGKTALHAAVSVAHSGLVEALLTERPGLGKVAAQCGDNPFHCALSLNILSMVRLLLELDASLAYLVDEKGDPPIVSAALLGHGRIFKAIARRCPDAALMVSENGCNALHIAVENENEEIVEYILRTPLLQRLINQPNHKGDLPWHLAVRTCNTRTLQAFMACKGLDKAAVNSQGKTVVNLFFDLDSTTRNLKWVYTFFTLVIAFPNEERFHSYHQKFLRGLFSAKTELLTQSYINNTTVVAVLMSTVTFAAAFTVPGGYDGNPGADQGLPILARTAAFKIFLISDTVSMCTSLLVAFLGIFFLWADTDSLIHYILFTRFLLWCAFMGMSLAFATGLYTVMAPGSLWLAAIICVLSCVLPPVTYHLAPPIAPKGLTRLVLKNSFTNIYIKIMRLIKR